MLRNFFAKEKTVLLDEQRNACLLEMEKVGVTSDQYPILLGYLERLDKLKAGERLEPVSRDTIANIVGGWIGILLIVAYENKHVVTSKGFSLIPKLKGT